MLFMDDKGNYPRHIGDVHLINKDYVFGNDLPNGWRQVMPTPLPATSENQKVKELAPEEIDGVFYQKFEVVELSQDEIQMQNLSLAELKQLVMGA